ncbi:MAG: tetratricopeptide repeat protein [Desulfovibrionaceae bacterium]|nr:tetratricopeptide repeat protein [Desulfovibrionaceae bacterium]MBF0513024.1 tetratricopeptide repeat protein [Desulfovibrionaceae bacterium]
MSSHLDYEINKELGECYLFMGDMDKAEEYYTKAASSNGVHPDPYLGLATIAVQRGELDKALGLYRKAAAIEPGDKALAGIGLIELENGAHESAFANFGGALDKNPENIIALFGLIRLGYVLERLGEVIPRLRDYLSLDPLKHDIRFSLAGCLVAAGNAGEAKTHLERILEHEPENKDAANLLDAIVRQAA